MTSAGPVPCAGATISAAVLTAATVLATPVSATPVAAQVRAVTPTAGVLDPYVELITNTFGNLGAIGRDFLRDPLPVPTQLLTNVADYAQTAGTAFVDAGRSFVDGLINLPDQLRVVFSAISEHDVEKFLAESIILVLSTFPVPGLIDRLLVIPYEVVASLVSGGLATLHALQVPVGLAGLTWLGATFTELGSVGKDLFDDLRTGDFGGALTQLAEAPALVLNAALNGEQPGLAGLLTPFEDPHQSGLVDAVVNYLPQTVAAGLGAGLGDVPAGTGDFVDALG